MARNIIMSLPKRLDIKVIVIIKEQYVSTMKVDEIIGSLHTFEMIPNYKSKKRNKSVAFEVDVEDDEE